MPYIARWFQLKESHGYFHARILIIIIISIQGREEMKIMPYISPSVVQEVKRIDLLTYLKNYEPYELVHFSGNTYTTRTHDSLKISNGKWMWWSQRIGGRSALDYLIKVKDYSFWRRLNCLQKDDQSVCPSLPQKARENRRVYF